MFLVNIPHLIAWTMLYYSTTLTEVFIAHILLGLGVGLMEVFTTFLLNKIIFEHSLFVITFVGANYHLRW